MQARQYDPKHFLFTMTRKPFGFPEFNVLLCAKSLRSREVEESSTSPASCQNLHHRHSEDDTDILRAYMSCRSPVVALELRALSASPARVVQADTSTSCSTASTATHLAPYHLASTHFGGGLHSAYTSLEVNRCSIPLDFAPLVLVGPSRTTFNANPSVLNKETKRRTRRTRVLLG